MRLLVVIVIRRGVITAFAFVHLAVAAKVRDHGEMTAAAFDVASKG